MGKRATTLLERETRGHLEAALDEIEDCGTCYPAELLGVANKGLVDGGIFRCITLLTYR